MSRLVNAVPRRMPVRRRRRRRALVLFALLFQCVIMPGAMLVLSALLIVGLYNLGELILH